MADSSIDFHFGAGSRMLYGSLGCLEQRGLERIGRLVEDDCKAYVVAGYADIILYHAEFNYIFARAGIAHRREGICYQGRIQVHEYC